MWPGVLRDHVLFLDVTALIAFAAPKQHVADCSSGDHRSEARTLRPSDSPIWIRVKANDVCMQKVC